MKILLITDEVWNDEIHGNNVLSNWFNGFDAEFANVYCSPGKPRHIVCKKYFQITDSMMLKSLISKQKAGISFYSDIKGDFSANIENVNTKLYNFLKSISTESIRLLREILWSVGKYNIELLEQFINDFKPDIIFSPRFASIKILRLEKIIHKISNVPIIAFTGDNEYSLKAFSLSPFFWIRKFLTRSVINKWMYIYARYYTLSEEQLEEYTRKFGAKFAILRKGGDFSRELIEKKINNPIRIIYAGKLYSNRWKTLSKLVKTIKCVNAHKQKYILEIYTKDTISRRQNKLLNDKKNSYIKGVVSPENLKRIYEESDIALHVESFDLTNKLKTRLSFSTKIIDCLASGCAVMVISWEKHSGFTYLKKEDAAFSLNNTKLVKQTLEQIYDNPEILNIYIEKAHSCGVRNHHIYQVQEKLYKDFIQVIEEKN